MVKGSQEENHLWVSLLLLALVVSFCRDVIKADLWGALFDERPSDNAYRSQSSRTYSHLQGLVPRTSSILPCVRLGAVVNLSIRPFQIQTSEYKSAPAPACLVETKTEWILQAASPPTPHPPPKKKKQGFGDKDQIIQKVAERPMAKSGRV